MQQSVKERIMIFIKKKGISIKRFERESGLSNGYVSHLQKSPTTDKVERIISAFPTLNKEWLMTGEGEMLNKETEKFREYPKVIEGPCIEAKPYFDVDFIGGFQEIFNDQTIYPTYNIIVPGFEKASVWCNVTGHSMEPKINHGDIIALRECTIEDIQYGEIYAVVLDTFRTIKILRSAPSPDSLLFVPLNQPDYEPQTFLRSRILRVYEVIGAISKFF